MIKRKVIITILVILVAVISVVAWAGRNSNMLRDIEPADVKEITFQDSFESITITEQVDIHLIFKELQSLKFKSMISYHRFGSALVFDIKLKSGQKYTMSVLADDIIINGKNYKPIKDYTDDLKSIMNNLS
jgi:hypothetical protein